MALKIRKYNYTLLYHTNDPFQFERGTCTFYYQIYGFFYENQIYGL
jgi:hypothetical protein